MFTMRKYEMLGFFTISLISIILTVIFWFLPSNFILDGVGPTSDSLWQVGKLLFISTLIYVIMEYYIFGRAFKNFMFAKAATLFIGPLVFIGTSYILDLIMGGASFNNHVLTYAMAILAGQYISYYILNSGYYFKLMNAYAIIGILLMMTIYVSFGKVIDKFNSLIFKPMKDYQVYIQYRE